MIAPATLPRPSWPGGLGRARFALVTHVAAPREGRRAKRGLRGSRFYRTQLVFARGATPGTLRFRSSRGCATRSPKGEAWWSQAGSNRRPLACHASALPAELWPRYLMPARLGRRAGQQNPEHSSGSTSSLLVAADVADDVGDVLVAFLFVGDEGGIVIIIAFDGLVDLDVVFRLGNAGLDLAGILFAVGLLERTQLFGLSR